MENELTENARLNMVKNLISAQPRITPPLPYPLRNIVSTRYEVKAVFFVLCFVDGKWTY